MTDDGAPNNWKRISGRVQSAWLSPEGKFVLLGVPAKSDDDLAHNCDAMGCGQDHVLFRGRLDANGIDALGVFANKDQP